MGTVSCRLTLAWQFFDFQCVRMRMKENQNMKNWPINFSKIINIFETIAICDLEGIIDLKYVSLVYLATHYQ